MLPTKRESAVRSCIKRTNSASSSSPRTARAWSFSTSFFVRSACRFSSSTSFAMPLSLSMIFQPKEPGWSLLPLMNFDSQSCVDSVSGFLSAWLNRRTKRCKSSPRRCSTKLSHGYGNFDIACPRIALKTERISPGTTPALPDSRTQQSSVKAVSCRSRTAEALRNTPGAFTLPAIISLGPSQKNRSCGRLAAIVISSALPVLRPARPARCT